MTYADKLLTVIAYQTNLNGCLISELIRQALLANSRAEIDISKNIQSFRDFVDRNNEINKMIADIIEHGDN